MQLSLGQSFEKERFTRELKEAQDIERIRAVALQLLEAWYTQKAATEWVMRQSLARPAILLPYPSKNDVPEDDQQENP
jgi:hypothetical protein